MCPSVNVHLVGGILDEVYHAIIDESFAGPLEHPHPSITTGSGIPLGDFYLEFSLDNGH